MRWTAALTAASCSMLLAGCGMFGGSSSGSTASTSTITPSDFTQPAANPPVTRAAPPAPAAAPETAITTAAPAPASNSKPAPAPAPLPTTASGGKPAEFAMDAMVGQVNGKPIYASSIFKTIGEDVFERLGQEKPRLEFRQSAKELIEADLRTRIQNQLLLAEAERGLSEREHMGLADYLMRERERLLAQYGGGVPALAEENLKRQRGHGLTEELESLRQKALTSKFLGEKINPKIHVGRRDVERYFQDHIKEFQQDPSITLRLIVAPNESVAGSVEKDLAAGKPFEKIAGDHSIVRAEQGGLMGPYKTLPSQFKELRWNELNEAVQKLEAGGVSPRIKIDLGYAWIKLDKVEGGQKQELKDVYNELEGRLRASKFQQLTRRYMVDLMSKGNYTPVDQMSSALLDVAMTRFARPQ